MIFEKKAEPMCSLGRIGVITSLKNLRIFSCDLRVQIHQGPDTIFGSMYSCTASGSNHNHRNIRVPTTISGSIIESSNSYIASGLQSRSHDLEKRPPGPKQRTHGQREPPGSSTTFGSPDNPRSACNLRVTRSFSRVLESVC